MRVGKYILDKHIKNKNVNEETVNDIIKTCRQNFFDSDQPKKYKDELKRMEIKVNVSNRLKNLFGESYMVEAFGQKDFKQRKYLDLNSNNCQKYYIDCWKKWYYIVIAVNKRLHQFLSKKELFETVSHEYAHALEFLVEGDSDHTDLWRSFYKSMGGSGKIWSKSKVPDIYYEVV